jgi:hypothetical protein
MMIEQMKDFLEFSPFLLVSGGFADTALELSLEF